LAQKSEELKKLIIIGSSGFVGQSLKDYIKSKKTKFSRIINFSRTEKKNIIKFKKLPKADYIIYCINNKNINKSLKYFFHFKKLLIKYSKKTKILFISSGAVYGPRSSNKKFKENEKLNFNRINKFKGYKKKYAKEKLLLENEFKKIGMDGFKVSIARGFTFYGRYILKYNYVISQIINSMRSNKKIIINNQYTLRSYMHADDMCRWIIKIIEVSSTKCPIYNVGSDKVFNIKNLAKFLAKKNNSEIIFKKNKLRKLDFYVPSTYLAKKKLKLKTTINFIDAINSLINLK